MKETKRIISLFEKLYEGSPWIDVNITASLANISAQQAATRVFPKSNTIWEIVNHLISWRLNVLKRIQGKVIKTPENNYFAPVVDTSDAAWIKTQQKFKKAQQQWINCLEDFKADNFSTVYPNNEMNYYEHIHGILQHDAYHLGQIKMLAKYF